MNRLVALFLALIVATLTVSSACVAAPNDWISFSLDTQNGGGQIKARFRDDDQGFRHNNWSSSFVPSQLLGLDLAALHASGLRQVRFSLGRDAGRLDCSGNGGTGVANGRCSLAVDPGFVQLLLSYGVTRPTPEQAFELMALNVRRELVDAVASARYPTPTVDDLMTMTAVGINGSYIGGLSHAGYRPSSIRGLVEFRALGITPEWIGGFVRAGYSNLPANELVQLRALNVTPEFISGYDRIGYPNLPASKLVQLKALDITPEFVRAHVAPRSPLPPIDELMNMKMSGRQR
jgi:hypothetical protein